MEPERHSIYSSVIIFSGYYVNEPDDIDVPLSKRINRLNIENPVSSNIAGRDSPAFSSNSSRETNALQSPYQHERLNDTINIDNKGIHTPQSANYLNSTSLQNSSHQSMQQNHVIGNTNVINHMQSHNVPQHNGASSSNHYLANTPQSANYLNSSSLQNGSHQSMQQNHVIGNTNVINHMHSHNVPQHNEAPSSNHYLENINLAPDSSFKERYNYPESSLYYGPNQLLNSLYQERQLRQNNTSQ